MRELKQFINWRLEDRDDSKPAKVPFSPVTGKRINPIDPKTWMTYEQASALGNVGFVFTESDPYAFIDLDNCITPEWNDDALEMQRRFPDAYIETSQSGKGLHIFFSYRGVAPSHSTRGGPGVEFYTKDRFVALGTHISGSASVDHTAALHVLCAERFPPKATAESVEWTSEPVENYTGTFNDDKLIEKACKTASPAVVLGQVCSFAALWGGDTDEIAKFFPDAARDYDASSADLALAKHLSYWTGDNCERIEGLMHRSGIAREKYSRDDYLQRTILMAVGGKVYDYAPPVPDPATVPDLVAAASPGVSASSGMPFMTIPDQIKFFEGCIFVVSLNRVMMPNGMLLGKDAFNSTVKTYEFSRELGHGTKTTRSAWEAFNQSLAYEQPQADGTCFDPCEPWDVPFTQGGTTYANTYRPIPVEETKGDVTQFLDHIAEMLPDPRDQDILKSYMAAVVQYKGSKFHWAVVLQGAPGNGKSMITSVMHAALGHHYGTASGSDLASKFNGWCADKILVGISDVQLDLAAMEVMKPMISDKVISIQRKGQDQQTSRSCVNFMFTTNDKAAIPKDADDRRYSVFFTAQQSYHQINTKRVSAVYDWLNFEDGFAMVNHWLATWKIPDEFNPARGCKRAPETSTTAAVIEASTGEHEQFVQDFIDEGHAGFRDGWVSRSMLSRLFKEINVKSTPKKLQNILTKMGYVPHPALSCGGYKCGRTNTRVSPDGCKAELWVEEDSVKLRIEKNVDAAKAYEKANS